VTLLPRLAVTAGVTEGTDLILRPLGMPRVRGERWASRGGRMRLRQQIIGRWRPHLAETCREAAC